MRASDFLEIGGFYPRLLPHYLSDYEFTIRAHRKQMSLLRDPSLKLWTCEEREGNLSDEENVAFIRKYFSKKNPTEPFAWTSFIVLACPWPWKPVHLVRVWIRAIRNITENLFKISHTA